MGSLIILSLLFTSLLGQVTNHRNMYASGTDAEICRDCIDSTATWYCYDYLTNSGKCCNNLNDSKCQSGPRTYCSYDYLQQENAKYLLCPEDTANCGTQLLPLRNTSNVNQSIQRTSIWGNTVCWFRITPDEINNYLWVYLVNLTSGSAGLYYEKNYRDYKYINGLSNSKNIRTKISDKIAIYLLVVPQRTLVTSLSFVNSVEKAEEEIKGITGTIILFSVATILSALVLMAIQLIYLSLRKNLQAKIKRKRRVKRYKINNPYIPDEIELKKEEIKDEIKDNKARRSTDDNFLSGKSKSRSFNSFFESSDNHEIDRIFLKSSERQSKMNSSYN